MPVPSFTVIIPPLTCNLVPGPVVPIPTLPACVAVNVAEPPVAKVKEVSLTPVIY